MTYLYDCDGKSLERVFLSSEDEEMCAVMGISLCKSCFFNNTVSCSDYPCLKSEDQEGRRSVYREVTHG